MTDHELLFRLAAALVWILGFGVRFYFQRQVRGVERTSARHVSRDRVLYFLVFGAFLLPLVYALSPLLDFAHVALLGLLRGLGVMIGLAAVALLYVTHRALGHNWSGILELARDHQLVQHGPYARVRHPMYTALFGAALGYALLSANWIIAAATLGTTAAMYAARVRDEEQLMRDRFGAAYEAYMARTGRLLPKLARSRR